MTACGGAFCNDATVAMIVTGAGESFALLCVRFDDSWRLELLPNRLLADVEALSTAVRGQSDGTPAFVLANIGDDFFVAFRRLGNEDLLLLSDITAAEVDDLARQACDRLDIDIPTDEDDDVRPAGDLDIFEDLGLPAGELSAILADIDAYADEQLQTIARELGFDEQFDELVDVQVR